MEASHRATFENNKNALKVCFVNDPISLRVDVIEQEEGRKGGNKPSSILHQSVLYLYECSPSGFSLFPLEIRITGFPEATMTALATSSSLLAITNPSANFLSSGSPLKSKNQFLVSINPSTLSGEATRATCRRPLRVQARFVTIINVPAESNYVSVFVASLAYHRVLRYHAAIQTCLMWICFEPIGDPAVALDVFVRKPWIKETKRQTRSKDI
ncbi:uncharacterized protein LOC119985614 [Tripterygium wilfordii]|uniref:uncharacterized protein LOC119985614 n=1 Tax=Tripterygium wilfordii TaxID=458696 RepID=UPI0018F84E0A|nr:uncharacterized protein LOC119985614 [Tripterygium wilfordii]